jgi:hypothetical protein
MPNVPNEQAGFSLASGLAAMSYRVAIEEGFG